MFPVINPFFQFSFHCSISTAIIGSAVVGLLFSILLVMIIVYRMRSKEEDCCESAKPPMHGAYGRGERQGLHWLPAGNINQPVLII